AMSSTTTRPGKLLALGSFRGVPYARFGNAMVGTSLRGSASGRNPRPPGEHSRRGRHLAASRQKHFGNLTDQTRITYAQVRQMEQKRLTDVFFQVGVFAETLQQQSQAILELRHGHAVRN